MQRLLSVPCVLSHSPVSLALLCLALLCLAQHPDLIEKQRRVFSDAIKTYADPQPLGKAAARGGKAAK